MGDRLNVRLDRDSWPKRDIPTLAAWFARKHRAHGTAYKVLRAGTVHEVPNLASAVRRMRQARAHCATARSTEWNAASTCKEGIVPLPTSRHAQNAPSTIAQNPTLPLVAGNFDCDTTPKMHIEPGRSYVEIQQALRSLILSKSAPVIALSGAWGTGKSHLWREIDESIRAKDSAWLFRRIGVSLFGVGTIEELKWKLLQNIAQQDESATKRTIKQLVGAASHLAGSVH